MFQPFFLLHHILKMLFLYLHIFTIPRIELKSVIFFVVSCLICTQTFFVKKWACVALYDVGHLHLLKRDHYRPSNSAKFFCKKCWKCKFTASLGRQLPCSKKMHRTSIQSFNWCKIAKEQNNSLSKNSNGYLLMYSTDIAPIR